MLACLKIGVTAPPNQMIYLFLSLFLPIQTKPGFRTLETNHRYILSADFCDWNHEFLVFARPTVTLVVSWFRCKTRPGGTASGSDLTSYESVLVRH